MKYNFLKENNTNKTTISEEIRKGDYDFFSIELFFAADWVRIIKIIIIFISFLLNLLYIISYIKTKLRKKQPQKNNLSFCFILIIIILIINFLHTFSFLLDWMIYVENDYYELVADNNVYHIGGLLIGNPSNSMTMCSIQGLLMIFSSLSQDALINIFFYFMDKTEIPDKTTLKLMLIFLGFLIPLLFSFIYLISGNIGINERYCFIKKFNFDSNGYHFNEELFLTPSILLYSFRGINLIISLIFLYRMIKYIRQENISNKYIIKILIILITQILSISFELTYFILDQVIKNDTIYDISDTFLILNTLDSIIFPLIFSFANSTFKNLFCYKERNASEITVTEDGNKYFESYDSSFEASEKVNNEKEKEKEIKRFSLVQFIDTNNFDISF